MNLWDLPRYLTIDVAASLEERFMNSEELYARFLRKLLNAPDFGALQANVADENWPEALRLAHNLKGVCANLGLNALSAAFAKLVTLLRGASFTPEQARSQLALIEPEWEKTLRCIEALD